MTRNVSYLQKEKPTKTFIAIDGEGKNTPNGRHIYTYLAASTGDAIRNTTSLPTVQCLDFLLNFHLRGTLVGFSVNYDVNMMLKDVPKPQLIQLWNKGVCFYYTNGARYRLEWR